MSFIWPLSFLLLLFIPVLVWSYSVVDRRRQKAIARFSVMGYRQPTSPGKVSRRRHVTPALFLLAFVLLIVALARPQAVVSLPKITGTVMLAFDVSGSMAADDLKPTRIEAAKVAARDFVDKQPATVQIGVIAFSDSGFSVQPPTNERDAIYASLNRLTPQRGTSLANGIFAALSAMVPAGPPPPRLYSNLTPQPTPSPTPMPKGQYTSGVIVLLTDGENNEQPDPMLAAQAAIDRGVRIYTVGIGSPAGTTVHVNGFTLHTQLNEEMLQQISEATDGTYYNAESEQELLKVYDNLTPQLTVKPEKMEITSIFVGISVLVMLVGGVFSLLWYSRLP